MASRGVNKVILVGHVGRDPEVRYTQGGNAVANFSLATSESWTSKTGERQERTEWHKIVVWGKSAEIAEKYVRKGRQLYIEGSLQTRQWEDKSGQKRYTTEVKAQRFVMLGRRDEGAGERVEAMGASGGAGAEGPVMEDGGPTYNDDDIPF